MNTQTGFITKVILLSAAVSLLIKFAGPFFPITETNLTALTLVLLPSAILGVIFAWRSRSVV
jgi:hypothetical protein